MKEILGLSHLQNSQTVYSLSRPWAQQGRDAELLQSLASGGSDALPQRAPWGTTVPGRPLLCPSSRLPPPATLPACRAFLQDQTFPSFRLTPVLRHAEERRECVRPSRGGDTQACLAPLCDLRSRGSWPCCLPSLGASVLRVPLQPLKKSQGVGLEMPLSSKGPGHLLNHTCTGILSEANRLASGTPSGMNLAPSGIYVPKPFQPAGRGPCPLPHCSLSTPSGLGTGRDLEGPCWWEGWGIGAAEGALFSGCGETHRANGKAPGSWHGGHSLPFPSLGSEELTGVLSAGSRGLQSLTTAAPPSPAATSHRVNSSISGRSPASSTVSLNK